MMTIAICSMVGVASFVLAGDWLTLRQQSVLFAAVTFGYLFTVHRIKPVLRSEDAPQPLARPIPTTHAAPRDRATPSPPPPTYRQSEQPVVATGMTEEQRYINSLLHARKMFQMTSGQPVETPDYILYMLRSEPGRQLAALRGYLGDLANEIFKFRGQMGDPVTVTLNEQPLYLRVTAQQRRMLPWSYRNTQSLRPNVAQVGVYWQHSQPTTMSIDFADQKQWSLGVFSSSGGGKSMLLRSALLSLLESCTPADTQFYLIDLDSSQYDAYKLLPHVRCVAETDKQALAVLQHLAALVEADRDLSNTVRRYVVIDEFQMLSAQSAFADGIMAAMEVLAQRGRKHGINLLLSTQDPSGGNYPTALQRNTKVILAGLTEDASYLKRFFGVEDADLLQGDGDFVYKSAGKQTNFKGFYISDADVADTIGAITLRWGIDERLIEFEEEKTPTVPPTGPTIPPTTAPTIPPTAPTERLVLSVGSRSDSRSRVADDAMKILPYLAEAYDEDEGTWRNGWAARLIVLLYGEKKPSAGSYLGRLNAALSYAQMNLLADAE